MTNPDEVAAGRPVVLRGGTVLTMDDAHTILADADVLVTGDRIAAVGPRLEAPDGALEIDASGGIVMPGMIDTHRHMWQTAMRAYGADWTLTQYFVWNYLEHGRKFRPEDIDAGNLVSAWEALEAGVTTTRGLVAQPADPRPRRGRRRRAARGARAVRPGLRQHPGRPVGVDRRPGRPVVLRPAPRVRHARASRSPSTSPATRPSRRRRRSRWPASWACRHHPRRGVGRHQRRRHPADARERVHDPGERLRARGHPEHRLLPAHRRHRRAPSRCRPSRSRARARATRPPGRSAATASRSRCPWTPASGGAATCSRPCARPSAPTGPASTSRRT